MQSSNFYFQASAVPASRFFPSSSCRAPSLSAPPAHALLLLLPHSLYLCPQLTLSSSASRRAPAVPAPADALLRLPPRSALPRAHAPLLLLPLSHSLSLSPPRLALLPPTRCRASTLLRGSPPPRPAALRAPAPDQAARPPRFASSSPGLPPGDHLPPSLGPRWGRGLGLGLGLPLCPLTPKAGPLGGGGRSSPSPSGKRAFPVISARYRGAPASLPSPITWGIPPPPMWRSCCSALPPSEGRHAAARLSRSGTLSPPPRWPRL